MIIEMFDSEAYCGYTQKTTFFMDFSIADNFGVSAIKDTYRRAFKEWKTNVEYLTELVMVLNWKLWQHFERGNYDTAKVYDELWRKAQDYAYSHLEGDDLNYFYATTD